MPFSQKACDLFRRLGQVSQERGDGSEQRVCIAFDEPFDAPLWFKGVSRAPWELDRKGVDVIVETTDLGKLYLQIKSSESGVQNFAKKGRKNIAIVLIRGGDTLDEIRTKVLNALQPLRSELEKMRSKYAITE
ncbi:MAG: hypothetical protein Q7S15_02385 [bacterium]|nr:hypothetical protein [bacterium]